MFGGKKMSPTCPLKKLERLKKKIERAGTLQIQNTRNMPQCMQMSYLFFKANTIFSLSVTIISLFEITHLIGYLSPDSALEIGKGKSLGWEWEEVDRVSETARLESTLRIP